MTNYYVIGLLQAYLYHMSSQISGLRLLRSSLVVYSTGRPSIWVTSVIIILLVMIWIFVAGCTYQVHLVGRDGVAWKGRGC